MILQPTQPPPSPPLVHVDGGGKRVWRLGGKDAFMEGVTKGCLWKGVEECVLRGGTRYIAWDIEGGGEVYGCVRRFREGMQK